MNIRWMELDDVRKQQKMRRDGSNNDYSSLWSDIDDIRKRPADFNCGKIIRVDHKHLLGVVMLCHAKLVCLNKMPSAAC